MCKFFFLIFLILITSVIGYSSSTQIKYTIPGMWCGNLICDWTETCTSCQFDCGPCPPSPTGSGTSSLSSSLKYDIFPRIINRKLITGDLIEESFIIKNLEDNQIIVVNLDTHLDIEEKTFTIQPNSVLEVLFLLSGPVGNFSREIGVELLTVSGEKVLDKVLVNYEIEGGVTKSESFSIKKWGKEHPEFFFISAVILLIALVSWIIIKRKNINVVGLVPISKLDKRVLMWSASGVIAVVLLVSLFVGLNPKIQGGGEAEVEFYSNSPHIPPSVLKYDITPRVISKTLLVGEVANENFVIKNLESTFLIVTLETELGVTPKSLVIPSDESREINFKLGGRPEGTYLNLINLHIDNGLGDKVNDKVTVTHKVVKGKGAGEVCLSNVECYSKRCSNDKCVSAVAPLELLDTQKSWAKQHPEYFIVMALVLIIAFALIYLKQGWKMSEMEKRLSTILILVVVIGLAVSGIFILNDENVEKVEEDTLVFTESISGNDIQYEITPKLITGTMKAGVRTEIPITIKNLERNQLVISINADIYVTPSNFLIEPMEEQTVNVWVESPQGNYSKEVNINAKMIGLSEISSVHLDYEVTEGEPQGQTSFYNWMRSNLWAVGLFFGLLIFILVAILLSNISIKSLEGGK